MTMLASHFAISESRGNGVVRLSLEGELDLAAAPVLERRLDALRSQTQLIQLDLSKLEFIDSTGIHLLLRTVYAARDNGWRLEVESELAPQVERVLNLVHLTDVIVGEHSTGP